MVDVGRKAVRYKCLRERIESRCKGCEHCINGTGVCMKSSIGDGAVQHIFAVRVCPIGRVAG